MSFPKEKLLNKKLIHITILNFDRIDSTNTEAIRQAKAGGKEGLCIVAKQQTAGRGRQGRIWNSEKDSGLYFSIVLYPILELRFLPLITLMTSVVVYEVLQELYQLKPDIKWSNDIHIGEKKISGILAETTETNNGLAIVVGIGINLNSNNFSAELSKKATSIEQETKLKPDFEELLNSLIMFFKYFYEIIQSEQGTKIIRNEWKQRSSFFEGKTVRAILENEIIIGETCGIENNGALRIRSADGNLHIIQAGDVEKLRRFEN